MTETPIPERLANAFEGRYRLIRELGQGGMATVYLAEDLKHDRQVAIKVLKPELAAVIGGERFVAEIKTTAGLQHPHILPLFDSGESDSFLFYVMPYVEGETLRDRLDRERQLGVEDALRITRDVADALDYAHRQGVIHRDIKPENILLHDGRPVVADFGIAVAISAAGGGRMTETGLSLGTPHYMSPEQATADRDLTVRSDVYSLACVLYEMLAGDPPHTGPTAQAILVRILTDTPRPVNDTRTSVPPHIAAVLSKGLEKLPADRFDSAANFRAALDRPDFTYTSVARGTGVVGAPVQALGGAAQGAVAGATRRPGAAVVGLGAATVLFAALALFGWLRSGGTDEATAAFTLDAPGWNLSRSARVVIAPDARHFVTVGEAADSSSEGLHILIRRADESNFRSLVGPGALDFPAFSPDGTRIAFVDVEDDAIRVVPVGGGQPNTLYSSDGGGPEELAWGDDGYIYFWETHVGRIPETGGEFEVLVENAGWAYEATPLPGGRGLLVTDIRGGTPSLRLFDFGSDSGRVLLPEATGGTWVETGHLVYAHPEGGLQAVAFDLRRLEVTGAPTPVRDGISVSGPTPYYSLARDGTLVFSEGRSGRAFGGGLRVLVERDLGTSEETRIPLEPRGIRGVRYAPDGDRVAFGAGAPGEASTDDFQVYTYDLRLGLTPRPWTDRSENSDASWSPDGTRLAFVEYDGSRPRIMIQDVTTESAARPAPSAGEDVIAFDPVWASDSTVLFAGGIPANPDLWVTRVDEAAVPEPYLESEWDLRNPAVSPGGDRVAYVNRNQYDVREVVVRSFPAAGEPNRVSFGRGRDPRWHPDGGSIFYLRLFENGDGESVDQLRRAFVSTDPVFRVDSTVVVIEEIDVVDWDLHPSGTRIILTRNAESEQSGDADQPGVPERHIVVLNWFEELKARLGN